MKNIFLFGVLLAAVLGCDLSRFFGSSNGSNANVANRSPSPEVKPSATIAPSPKPSSATPGLISFLKKSVGKYPYDIKLLENVELRPRLKKLLGKDFSAMEGYFDVQAPLEIVDDVLMTTGCEAHNCGANQYLLFVDLKNDNINVFHVTDDETKHYFEKGEIKLPKKFAEQVSSE
jgi:hypothetical protein